jgi:muramoyltetrapeptide carboxypeptidase LdcA involved in peptidoglycan recycling
VVNRHGATFQEMKAMMFCKAQMETKMTLNFKFWTTFMEDQVTIASSAEICHTTILLTMPT